MANKRFVPGTPRLTTITGMTKQLLINGIFSTLPLENNHDVFRFVEGNSSAWVKIP